MAFSLSSTLVKRAHSPGVLLAFWRMVTVSVVWNVYLRSTGRRVTLRHVRQAFVPGVFFGLNLAIVFAGATHNSAANAALIGSLSPFFIVPIGARLFGEFINPRALVFALVAFGGVGEVPKSISDAATVVSDMRVIPIDSEVIVATSHMFGNTWYRLRDLLGSANDGEHLFDVLFVDEAWQLPLHRYRAVDRLAPIAVGVGDVGQLPPLDPGQNPWRGDRGYRPYRAWPTEYDRDARTWARELPAVWRPTAAQLPLWRAFYGDWDMLNCVAGPGDRRIETKGLSGGAAAVWDQVATGVPTLVEIQGLDDPDAADIDPPLLAVVEQGLDELLENGFALHEKSYHESGTPIRDVVVHSGDPQGRTLIAVLATRNQAVDDAQDMVDRLMKRHDLVEGAIVASTVDSWQGQTNALTVAIHPLSGASTLDEFNSAFGRLAVTCTRATHGLLMVSRAGLDDLLATAPARPGTPMGEPGTRQLPRQTHNRILSTFARGVYVA